jgi:hypothetical protein
MISTAEVLRAFRCHVLLPDLTRYQHIRDELGQHEKFNEIKHRLARQNADNVGAADALLIINPNHRGIVNYIGGNSFFEMSIAFYLHKPILLTHSVPEGLPYTEEVKSFLPVVVGPVENMTPDDWRSHARAAGIC